VWESDVVNHRVNVPIFYRRPEGGVCGRGPAHPNPPSDAVRLGPFKNAFFSLCTCTRAAKSDTLLPLLSLRHLPHTVSAATFPGCAPKRSERATACCRRTWRSKWRCVAHRVLCRAVLSAHSFDIDVTDLLWYLAASHGRCRPGGRWRRPGRHDVQVQHYVKLPLNLAAHTAV
jgi:hypothetical protein